MQANLINATDPYSFEDLYQLEGLNLATNRIQSIIKFAFVGLSNL